MPRSLLEPLDEYAATVRRDPVLGRWAYYVHRTQPNGVMAVGPLGTPALKFGLVETRETAWQYARLELDRMMRLDRERGF